MAKHEAISELERDIMFAVMRLQPQAYGVPIRKHIEEKTGREPSIGAVYAAFDRLEDRGFLKSKQGEPTAERGGRAKTFFSLTAPGRKALDAAHAAFTSMTSGYPWEKARA